MADEGRTQSDAEGSDIERLKNLPTSQEFAKDLAKDAEALAPQQPPKRPKRTRKTNT